MGAGKFNITIEQGVRFQITWTWKDGAGDPVDLTGYTAELQIRETKDSTTKIYDSDTGSDITLGGTAGTIALDIPTATTAAFDFDSAVYDLELTTGGETTRLLEGSVYLSREVTR